MRLDGIPAQETDLSLCTNGGTKPCVLGRGQAVAGPRGGRAVSRRQGWDPAVMQETHWGQDDLPRGKGESLGTYSH